MKISMRDIIKLKYDIWNYRTKYMNNLQIACLIASDELDIPTYELYAFKSPGSLFINVEIR